MHVKTGAFRPRIETRLDNLYVHRLTYDQNNFDDVDWVTFRSVAENGTVGALWKAAEDCFQQAKENNGDWHYFIEDFDMQEDGSLKLITGS